MPLYEYQCPSCNKVHEVMAKFSDPPLEKCPDCGGPVSKLMSMSSFALKGSGWYTTDYKKSSAPKSETATAEPAKAAEPAKTETPKTEAPKTEAPKTESKPKKD